jgi:two-component system, chemotaxis family, CheB/CheR fusion protein
VRSHDGNWYLTRLKPYRTVEDKIDGVVVTFVDIGERRRAEDAVRESESRMRILVGELQHRTRNLIGIVMAMADRTAVHGQSVEQFRTSFRERLMALSRVQGLLSRAAPGDGVAFDDVLESELSAQSAQNRGNITLDGPNGVVIRSGSVQALAMALHELTTNAVKHGALGQGNGRLNIRWRVETENGSPWILIDWKESGVDGIAAYASTGSGSGRRLIEDALPYQFGARTTFAVETDGVRCTIALPVSGPPIEEIQDGQPDSS